MKRTFGFLALVIVLALGSMAYAQNDRAAARQEKIFKNGKHKIVQGEVTAIKTMEGRNQQGARMVATVATDKGDLAVFLGPEQYLKDNHFELRVHDHITVEGSLVDIRGHEGLMAQTVHREQTELKLRDDSGKPLWTNKAK
jgi:hypothetical protein